MEDEHTYRWEKRRKRLESIKRTQSFRSFWGFELILVVLIFAVWLIGARILLVYAFTQNQCVEAVVSFGKSEFLPPLFDMFFIITLLLGVFWIAVTLRFERVLRTSKSAVFHVLLFFCILFLAFNFRMMHLDDFTPPDGTLSVRAMVVDTSGVAPVHYPVAPAHENYYGWHLGNPDINSNMPYRIDDQYCLWLDRNLIVDNSKSFAEIERKPIQTSLLGWVKGGVNLEMLRQKQRYRPLLPTERERFIQKQHCLKDNMYAPNQMSKCTWNYTYDAGRASLDYHSETKS